MNFTRRTLVLAASAACLFGHFAFAAETLNDKNPDEAIREATQDGKLAFLVFFKESNTATKTMLETVKTTSQKLDGTTCVTVNTADPAGRVVAEKYDVTRAPMPMVIGVHPNGAVTGYFAGKASEEGLAQCVVSPKKAECMKSLQKNMLVLVCLQSQKNQTLPKGVSELQADPHFANRTQIVTLSLNDPSEKSFLASMEVDPKKDTAMTVFLAPPGAMVGKFAPTATKDDLAAKLAEAGKCCDDKNCKHNQQPTKQTQKSGRTTR
jgi:hypothetical protein